MRSEDRPRLLPPLERYGSLASFYAADRRRIDSRELDVGLWWREDANGPLHRAAWVGDTGELYLVRLGPADAGGGQVELLATVAEQEQLEEMLEGWRERCGRPRSLTWLRRRAAQVEVRARRLALAASAATTGAMLAAAATMALELG
jgi:hypothetical protein